MQNDKTARKKTEKKIYITLGLAMNFLDPHQNQDSLKKKIDKLELLKNNQKKKVLCEINY